MKIKLALCYNTVVDKLGPKIKQFKDCDRLIQAVANLLNEGALEVRNMAKMGLLSLKGPYLSRSVTHTSESGSIWHSWLAMTSKNQLT